MKPLEGATDIFDEDRGSVQVQQQVSGTASRCRDQHQRLMSGAVASVCEAVVVTSRSFETGM
jgi:hypothetical protein